MKNEKCIFCLLAVLKISFIALPTSVFRWKTLLITHISYVINFKFFSLCTIMYHKRIICHHHFLIIIVIKYTNKGKCILYVLVSIWPTLPSLDVTTRIKKYSSESRFFKTFLSSNYKNTVSVHFAVFLI